MKILMIEDYSDFECIGDKCEICCCGGGWDIVVDDESARKYRAVDGEFGDELRSNLVDRNGKTYFLLNEKKECPFLNEQGLCRIYRTLGEEALCYTCETYPRSSCQVGDILFCHLTTSCPEVTRRIIERKEPVQIDFSETPNTKIQEIKLKKMDWVKFNGAINAYTLGMNILQNRSADIMTRIRLVMKLIYEYEKNTKNGDSNKTLFEKFLTDEGLEDACSEIQGFSFDWGLLTSSFSTVFSLIMGQSNNNPMWESIKEMTEKINSHGAFDLNELNTMLTCLNTEDIQIELEQVIAYRYFKTFMAGYDKTDHYEQMVSECILFMSLVFYIGLFKILFGTDSTRTDRIMFYSLCSRGDHSSATKESLNKWLEESEMYDFDRLMSVLCI